MSKSSSFTGFLKRLYNDFKKNKNTPSDVSRSQNQRQSQRPGIQSGNSSSQQNAKNTGSSSKDIKRSQNLQSAVVSRRSEGQKQEEIDYEKQKQEEIHIIMTELQKLPKVKVTAYRKLKHTSRRKQSFVSDHFIPASVGIKWKIENCPYNIENSNGTIEMLGKSGQKIIFTDQFSSDKTRNSYSYLSPPLQDQMREAQIDESVISLIKTKRLEHFQLIIYMIV